MCTLTKHIMKFKMAHFTTHWTDSPNLDSPPRSLEKAKWHRTWRIQNPQRSNQRPTCRNHPPILHPTPLLPLCKPVFLIPLQHLLQQSQQAIALWLDHNLPFLRRHHITPSPPPTILSPPTDSSTHHRTSSDEINENTKTPPPSTLTPIRPRSERVSSPHAVPNDPSC